MLHTSWRMIAGGVLFVLLLGVTALQAEGEPAAAADKKPVPFAGDPYLLSMDPVSGEKLGDKPIMYQHQDRELRFASQETLQQFQAEPAKYLAKVDQQMIQQQLPFYPLENCLVSADMKLGSMGKAIDQIYRNRLVRFCSQQDQAKFQKDPDKYIAQLDQAVIARQKADSKATACPVSKDKLGGDMGEPVDVVVGNRLVQLCCKHCLADLQKNPLKYLPAAGASSTSGEKAHEQGGSGHGGHGGHKH